MPRPKILWLYFALSYVAVLANAAVFLGRIQYDGPVTALFVGAVYATYCVLYMLPVVVPVMLADALLSWRRLDGLSPWTRTARAALVYGLAVAGLTGVQFFIFGDAFIHGLYGFHVNGFVLNLVTTRGGIESLGGSNSSIVTFSLIFVAFLLLQVGLLAAVLRVDRLRRLLCRVLTKRIAVAFVVVTAAAALMERGIHGVSSARNYTPVLAASHAMPFYLPTTFNHLARRLGLAVERRDSYRMTADLTRLNYPLAPIRRTAHEQYNIVWLVAESLRADALDPEIMPATWRFAAESNQFDKHYSGGNGTRMGIFSMFYGLYGSYWFPFLESQRSPVLMDVLMEDGYQMEMFTSAGFSYPEVDLTVFARVPKKDLQPVPAGLGWERDRINVTELLDFIDTRDPSRPFMTFMFFESPHARYYFPKESIIRRPFLKDLNYATLDLENDIELIRNRYHNACHHLDGQFDRVLTHLRENDLLDSTIVLITGDHGEEFMEHGRWGHNSAYTEEQVRVPMILHVPGRPPARHPHLTSHLDIPATILPLLGVENPPEDYSLGTDLLGPIERPFTVACGWSELAYIDDECKIVFPLRAGAFTSRQVTTRDDRPIEDDAPVLEARQERLVGIMRELKRFGY